MDEKLLRKAKKRVKQKKGFIRHTGIIIAVCIFLFVLAFIVGREEGKVFETALLIPMAAMILSVFIHYLSIWGIPGVAPMAEDWEANQLEKEYFRLKSLADTKKKLSDDEYLELRELELKYKDEDFV